MWSKWILKFNYNLSSAIYLNITARVLVVRAFIKVFVLILLESRLCWAILIKLVYFSLYGIRLYTEEYYVNEMSTEGIPEIQRTSLVSSVIQVCTMHCKLNLLNLCIMSFLEWYTLTVLTFEYYMLVEGSVFYFISTYLQISINIILITVV